MKKNIFFPFLSFPSINPSNTRIQLPPIVILVAVPNTLSTSFIKRGIHYSTQWYYSYSRNLYSSCFCLVPLSLFRASFHLHFFSLQYPSSDVPISHIPYPANPQGRKIGKTNIGSVYMGIMYLPAQEEGGTSSYTPMAAKPHLGCLFMSISLLSTSAIAWPDESVQTPPLPVLPLPTHSQLKWQKREIIMFLHFGVNTFTDSEWGTGHEDPKIFNPTSFNAAQWAATAEAAGISLMILTAKHHDGFCLWPSKYTAHSVKSSLWRGGAGDVVKDFVAAASSRGIDAGLYLSPWDRHDKRYGRDLDYNEYYLAQLRELLTQ